MSKPWQTIPTPDMSPRDLSWKRYASEACPHGLLIVLVDGTHVRNAHDSDFSQGGNGYRYDFVPKDEIWIDAQISETEWPFIAYHECREIELMKKGWSYDRAHDRAKMLEDQFRHARSSEMIAAGIMARQFEQEAHLHESRGEDRLASHAYGRAASIRFDMGQKKRADHLRGLAIRAIKDRYEDFYVNRPLALR